MSKLNLIHKLGGDVVAAIRTAEPYDHFRDQRLEDDTWSQSSSHRQGPGRMPSRNPNPYHQDIYNSVLSVKVDGRSLRLPVFGEQTVTGLLVISVDIPRNSPLEPVFTELAAKVAHFQFKRSELSAYYILPLTEKRPQQKNMRVKGYSQALKDFQTRILQAI